MNRKYIDDIWRLSRKRNKRVYRLRKIDADIIRKEKSVSDFPIIGIGKGEVTAYGSHSGRAAWVYSPWKDNRGWYTGFEYKGVGYEGGRIRRVGGTAWGGNYTHNAIAEHMYSKTAFDAGMFCQRPVAVYKYGKFYGKDIAVLVRAFASPLRLSDFLFDRRFYAMYLDIRNETKKEHCDAISTILGANIRKLLDIGLYHGTMGVNNITSEGEIADFEPTSGGTWEGLMNSEDPHFRYLSISRAMHAGRTMFPKHFNLFRQNFADAFFGERMELRTSNGAKEIAERYCKTGIETVKPESWETDPNVRKALMMIRAARKSSKTKMDRKILDFVIKTLTDPPE